MIGVHLVVVHGRMGSAVLHLVEVCALALQRDFSLASIQALVRSIVGEHPVMALDDAGSILPEMRTAANVGSSSNSLASMLFTNSLNLLTLPLLCCMERCSPCEVLLVCQSQ